ncbi:hypothetical protein MG293_012029 [Ovis ammon polii]|uniref:Uncharacterized protein n=1 Tax=Ovis ammon polii TaxID=230172 RepID=A0AAD4U3Q5_OVIAM|nr:hypothetical protein MG293_012029 [Ovis ammon polii]
MAATMKKAAAEDVHVTFEDQQKINKFARNTSRITELKEEIEVKKKQLQNLEDACEDIMLADDDCLMIPYQIGDVFISHSQEETQEMLEEAKLFCPRPVISHRCSVMSEKQRIDDELAGTIPPCTHLYLSFKSPSLSAIYFTKETDVILTCYTDVRSKGLIPDTHGPAFMEISHRGVENRPLAFASSLLGFIVYLSPSKIDASTKLALISGAIPSSLIQKLLLRSMTWKELTLANQGALTPFLVKPILSLSLDHYNVHKATAIYYLFFTSSPFSEDVRKALSSSEILLRVKGSDQDEKYPEAPELGRESKLMT